ncbi:MAG TPA: hypothetical protein VIV11_16625 [Kofleriaceae bacterium]
MRRKRACIADGLDDAPQQGVKPLLVIMLVIAGGLAVSSYLS